MAKILSVEDDKYVSEMLKTAFERKGHEVVAVADGSKVIDEVKKFAPDIVILDLMLPRLNGIEIAMKMNETEGMKKIPIVLVTGIPEVSASIAYPPNVADIFFKPYQFNEFSARIEEILSKK